MDLATCLMEFNEYILVIVQMLHYFTYLISQILFFDVTKGKAGKFNEASPDLS